MKSTTLTKYLSFLFFPLFFCCVEDEFYNVKSTIYGETESLVVTEGALDPILNIVLTEELSEDLIIEYKIIQDSEFNFKNINDYDVAFEYSNDFGSTWEKSINQNVILKSGVRNLKVRIPILDDYKIEFDEKFNLEFSLKTGSTLQINGNINSVQVSIVENEPSFVKGYKIDPFIDYIEGAFYHIDDDFNFTLVAINKNNLENIPLFIDFIDNGIDPKIKNDVINAAKATNHRLNFLELFYDDTSFLGYSVNLAGEPESEFTEDTWNMGLNIFYGYNTLNEFYETVPIQYNENGLIGATFIHEYGHILTLNDTEVDHGNYDCSDEYALWEGCLKNTSILANFYDKFFSGAYEFLSPQFVSNYASTDIFEDVAETFTWGVIQEKLDHPTEENSGAYNKIHFVYNHPNIEGVSEEFKKVISNATIDLSYNEPIYSFNRKNTGERVSCLDRKGNVIALRKGEFKRIKK